MKTVPSQLAISQTPLPLRKFREFQPSGGFSPILFRTALISESRSVLAECSDLIGIIRRCSGLGSIQKCIGSAGILQLRPEQSRERTKNEKGRRVSDFSAARRLFHSPGICCRSAVSRPLAGLVARYWRDYRKMHFVKKSEKICPPLSNGAQQAWDSQATRNLPNSGRTSVDVEPGPAGKDSRNI